MCPVEEIGRNSVMPSTMAVKITSMKFTVGRQFEQAGKKLSGKLAVTRSTNPAFFEGANEMKKGITTENSPAPPPGKDHPPALQIRPAT